MEQIDLKIGDMNCKKCADRLQGVLDASIGIKKATVSFAAGSASVSYRAQTISEAEVVALVENAGFTAERT